MNEKIVNLIKKTLIQQNQTEIGKIFNFKILEIDKWETIFDISKFSDDFKEIVNNSFSAITTHPQENNEAIFVINKNILKTEFTKNWSLTIMAAYNYLKHHKTKTTFFTDNPKNINAEQTEKEAIIWSIFYLFGYEDVLKGENLIKHKPSSFVQFLKKNTNFSEDYCWYACNAIIEFFITRSNYGL